MYRVFKSVNGGEAVIVGDCPSLTAAEEKVASLHNPPDVVAWLEAI